MVKTKPKLNIAVIIANIKGATNANSTKAPPSLRERRKEQSLRRLRRLRVVVWNVEGEATMESSLPNDGTLLLSKVFILFGPRQDRVEASPSDQRRERLLSIAYIGQISTSVITSLSPLWVIRNLSNS
jgi:hypothetical protein